MSQQKTEQKFVCVWLDNQSKPTKQFLETQTSLQNLVHSFRYYDNLNNCLNFITDTNHTEILLILNDIFTQKMISIIHSSDHIHSIYVFTSTSSTNKQWIKDYHKVKGIFNDTQLIEENIKENLTSSKSDQIGLSFLSCDDINEHDMKRQDPAFMYFQLLKDIILNDHREEHENDNKKDMLSFCRHRYVTDEDSLEVLNEFEENFLPELSIYWYTRECFLYKMLNKALWSPEPDVLYKLRYFIRHLHQQIVTQSELQRKKRTSMTLYRGQCLSIDQVNKLKENVGGYLSFNNFLSTSLKRDVATKFIRGSDIGVLFVMEIDSTIEKFPFANIEHLSFQQGEKNEREYLFSMGTVFRIVKVEKEKSIYLVKLKLSDDIDQQLADYTKRTRKETCSSHSFLSLLKLMNELSQYDCVDRFIQILDEEKSLTKNLILLGSIHHAFGIIYLSRGQPKKALDHFRKSLSMYLTVLPADHPKLSPTYNSIGSVHSSQSDYETALTFHQLALDCQTNSDNTDPSSVISSTQHIASIYYRQEKYDDALIHYKRILQLEEKHKNANDPSLSDTYNMISIIYHRLNDYQQSKLYHEKAIEIQEHLCQIDPQTSTHCSLTSGTFCFKQGEYDKALDHFNRALQIQQQYFLPNNPSLAVTYNCLANVYSKQNQYEQSLSYHRKALSIEQKSLSDDHSSIAESYFNISKDYAAFKHWSDALDYSLKAIEQLKKKSSPNFNTLSSYYQQIGYIYFEQHQYENALTYYKQALNISLNHLSDEDSSLIMIYYRIASSYEKLKEYDQALSFYQKTLDMELKTLPDNTKTIAVTYTNIATVYLYLNQFDNAFDNAQQALNQLLKTLPKTHPDIVQHRALLDAIKIKQILQKKQSQ